MTWWHITFGTYAARLHGDGRPTVDRGHNDYGTPFLPPDPKRMTQERSMLSGEPVLLTIEQRTHIERNLASLCNERNWTVRVCAAGPDHVHVLVNIPFAMHGKRARALIKRRLTQELDSYWHCVKRPDGSSWWGEGGSTKAVKDEVYFNTVVRYINKQRTVQSE